MRLLVAIGLEWTLAILSLAMPGWAASSPVISSVSPQSAIAGGPGFTLTVFGSGFTGQSVVLWNGSPRPTTNVNSTQLVASVSSTDIAVAAMASVSVLNTKPTTSQSNFIAFTIAPAVQITTLGLPNGMVGAAYGAQLSAIGGITPYIWGLAAGLLPSGLSLASSGSFSGTPAAAGSWSFTVQVSDQAGLKATQALTISIVSPLQITTLGLPNGTVGSAYSALLSATGGITPYAWGLAAGVLPAGLALSTSGAISGTPTTAGAYSFTVKASDSAGQMASQTFTVSIASAPLLTITTTSLPNGSVGAAYNAALSPTGGTPPYTWIVVLGLLPSGLTLQAATGAISGTPTASGVSSFTVQVRDSSLSPQTATAALSITISFGSLRITTTSLVSGVLQRAYSVTLNATGGTAPYSWIVPSGLLPTGLTLGGATGTIAGTPTLPGQFTFSVQVKDAALPTPQTFSESYTLTVQGPLDPYGGSTQLQCPAGVAMHFYTQKVGNRWWLCTPAGNVFWMRGMYAVETDGGVDYAGISYTNQAIAKYGNADLAWGPQQNRRLKSWGFNTLAEYASNYAQPTTTNPSWPNSQQPVLMPFTALAWPSYYTLFNQGNYAPGPVKELVRATKSTVYTGYRGHSPDIWDPNFKLWLDGFLANNPIAQAWINGPNNSYFIGFNVDDADFVQGFGAGPDFKTVSNGVASGGREQPHLAWIILVTPPTQTSNTEFGVTYTDTTVYSKQALMNFLQQRYLTIGALNLAWGSNYATFGSAGGWGTGTGLLDEDGTHLWIPKDYTSLSDANLNLKKDLDDFLFQHAQKYFSDIRSVLNTRAPGRLYLGPTTLSSWGGPPRRQILQAAAASLDIFMAATIPAGVLDDQQRIDFIAQYLGDKPWIEWEGFVANPDSYMYPFSASDTVQAQSTTQALRARAYTNMINLLIYSHTTAGAYPIVGFKWWQWVDNSGEQMNWGLVTRRDNEYDSRAASVGSGTDSWGFPTGSETNNYGNFLDTVQSQNLSILQTLLSRIW